MKKGMKMITLMLLTSALLFPDMKEVLKKGEVYTYLGEENEAKYNNRWKILKAS